MHTKSIHLFIALFISISSATSHAAQKISKLNQAAEIGGSASVSTESPSVDTREHASKGIRIGFVKPFLSYNIEATGGRGVYYKSDTETFEDTNGISAGYAQLPVRNLGLLVNLALLQIREESTTQGIVRLDGNLAYSFSSVVHIKGGLNLNKWFGRRDLEELFPNVGAGLQGGLGFQFNKTFGMDLSYVIMSQSAKRDDIEYRINEFGPEIGIHATF